MYNFYAMLEYMHDACQAPWYGSCMSSLMGAIVVPEAGSARYPRKNTYKIWRSKSRKYAKSKNFSGNCRN